ncbi:Dyp-type peroxidase [Pseudomonas putida]|nr:Dyp-type peroxidase [Pseudomonas putida]MBF8714585.1 Dyp-type peroxidase [Pseudomonas putida]
MDDHEIEPQAVDSAITRSAIFLVATFNPGDDSRDRVRTLCADLGGLVRSLGKRVPSGNLSCVIGFGAAVWDGLFGAPRPAGLHAFREFGSGERKAVATPGDILLHIRAEHMDLCFELAALVVKRLGQAVTMVDEVQGFRY